MANKRVRVLVPGVLAVHGVEAEGGKVISIDEDLADALIPQGAVEPVKTETATRKPSRSRKGKSEEE